MEQLVARRAHNPKVVGSSPAPATKKSSDVSLGFLYLRPNQIYLDEELDAKSQNERSECAFLWAVKYSGPTSEAS